MNPIGLIFIFSVFIFLVLVILLLLFGLYRLFRWLPNWKIRTAVGVTLCASFWGLLYFLTWQITSPSKSPYFRLTKGQMIYPRYGHQAVLLKDGRVLIIGGYSDIAHKPDKPITDSEIYDPKTETFIPAGRMNFSHVDGTATLLNDGRVLLTGGTEYKYRPPICRNQKTIDQSNTINRSAEIFDPNTRQFSVISNMLDPRFEHGASLLPDGNVLISGGRYYRCESFESKDHFGGMARDEVQFSQEIFNPKTGQFTYTNPLLIGHYDIQSLPFGPKEILIYGQPGYKVEHYNSKINRDKWPKEQEAKKAEVYNFITHQTRFVKSIPWNSKFRPKYDGTDLLFFNNEIMGLSLVSIQKDSRLKDGDYLNFYTMDDKHKGYHALLIDPIPRGPYTFPSVAVLPDHNILMLVYTQPIPPNPPQPLEGYIYQTKTGKLASLGKFPVKGGVSEFAVTTLPNASQVLITGGEYKTDWLGHQVSKQAWLYTPKKVRAEGYRR